MGTTISALVKGYLDTGEEKYFEELLERFSPLIKAYARKLSDQVGGWTSSAVLFWSG